MRFNDSSREEIQRFCTRIARDRLLVQAAGGNVSWKSDGSLWIKASGTWLADAGREDIFVPVDLQHIESGIESGDFTIKPRTLNGVSLRPSIETLLHALIPQKFVVHLHPVDVVAYLCRPNCEEEIRCLIDDTFTWDIVEYYKPGAELAQAVSLKLNKKRGLQVLFLKQHGVIFGAETLFEIDFLLSNLCRLFELSPRSLDIGSLSTNQLDSSQFKNSGFEISSDQLIQKFVTDSGLYKCLSDSWAICPDHVVFLGAAPVCINDPADAHETINSIDKSTPFIFIKNWCVLENHLITAAQRAQLIFYLDVISRQPSGLQLKHLSNTEASKLLDWDAEKYRQSLNL